MRPEFRGVRQQVPGASRSRPAAARGLLRPFELAAAAGATVLAFALLAPLAARRDREAREEAPDLVSLSYLRLSLELHPDDPVLRRSLVTALLAAGRFEEASAANAPPAERGDLEAQRLAVEISFRHWQATPAGALRDQLLARVRAASERLLATDRDPRTSERLSEICAATGLLSWRARLLEELARGGLEPRRVERADAAALAVGDPLAAARLWSALALQLGGPEGASAARRALERARSADRPAAALALWRSLEPRWGTRPELLELGLAISAGQDDALALALAERLLVRRPGDVALQRRTTELRAWLRPARPAVSRSSAEDELAVARAHWDLERVLALGRAQPEGRPELIERISLLEATGRIPEALAALDQARDGGFTDDPEVWGRALALELAAGQVEAGLATLEGMAGRFGVEREAAYRRSALLLSLGRAREALRVLQQLPLDTDADHARNLQRLAWELGDLGVVRKALQALTRSAQAEPADFEQLWLLDYETRDFSSALATAERGYARFASEDLLTLSIDAARAGGDARALRTLLALAEERHSPRLSDPGFWSSRVRLEQERESSALERGDAHAARRSYDEIERLLARARAAAPGGAASYGEIERAERRRALALALDADDLPRVAALYPSQEQSLSAGERVHVLARLGRHDEALQAALEQLDETPEASSPERDALEAQAETLVQQLPRQVWLGGSAQQIPSLFTLTLRAGAEHAFSRPLRLGALAELTRFDFTGSGWNGDELDSEGADSHELSAQLRGTYRDSALSLGMAARPDGTLRPFGSFEQQLIEQLQAQLLLIARVNERSLETARLRMFGAQDQLALRASFGLGDHIYLSADASGQTYWDLERDYQGSGATVSGGAGYNLALGPDLGSANLRIAGYLAPRLAADPNADFVTDGTSWLGAGASWSRGRLDAPPASGRSLAVLVDATLGWLVPQRELGWSARLGLGVSLLGADLLSLSLDASNVLGTTPGFAAYGIGAEYRVSEWK